MTQLLTTSVTEDMTPEAAALQNQMDAQEQQHQDDALAVAAKHKDATGMDAPNPNAAGELANHRAELNALGNEVNEATNALIKFALPGETIQETAARGKEQSNINQPIFKAAVRAIQAHTAMDMQQRAADNAAAEIADAADANEFSEMKNLRKQELRAAARRIAADEKISLADAFQIALIEIQVDGVETVLPSFAKVTKRAAARYAAEAGES